MRLISGILGLSALYLATSAQAVAGTVSVMPGTLSATLQSTLPTTLVWSVEIPPSVTHGGPLVVNSPQGTVSTPSGQILQIDSTPLTVNLSAAGQGSALEIFTLSPSTVATALRLGVNTLYLKRTFGVSPNSGSTMVVIHLGGIASGPLTLSRVALYFDNRALLRVLHPGEAVVAVAEIEYSGNGVLDGLWEVASPPSTLGEPVFVPLASATVNLAGGGSTEIASPPLPASAAGTYFVRFLVRSPAVPFTGLVIQYAVEAGAPQAPPIAVIGPAQNATLNANTLFQWTPAAGAMAYRLEFYGADLAEDSRPISGEWVPAVQRVAVLSVLASTHLQAGRVYRWRIVALNRQGQIVGRSAFYQIRTP